MKALLVGLGAALILSTAGVVCLGQSAKSPMFNTAGAGAKAADIEAAVALICKAKDRTLAKDGKISGCRTCPEGTDFHGIGNSSWEMYAETPGHFTSAQEDNLILDGTGCDSHASNFGGSFIFSFKDGKARLMRYGKGLVTSQCHKFAYADRRNFLICQRGWSGQGENDENLFMASFGVGGKATVKYLLSTTDSTGTCADDSAQVQESKIESVTFTPADSEKITGLTVTAKLGTVPCARAGKGAAQSYSVEFLFDGTKFVVAPASRAAWRRFEKD